MALGIVNIPENGVTPIKRGGTGKTTASETGAHAEGYETTASETGAHAEGDETIASGCLLYTSPSPRDS